MQKNKVNKVLKEVEDKVQKLPKSVDKERLLKDIEKKKQQTIEK